MGGARADDGSSHPRSLVSLDYSQYHRHYHLSSWSSLAPRRALSGSQPRRTWGQAHELCSDRVLRRPAVARCTAPPGAAPMPFPAFRCLHPKRAVALLGHGGCLAFRLWRALEPRPQANDFGQGSLETKPWARGGGTGRAPPAVPSLPVGDRGRVGPRMSCCLGGAAPGHTERAGATVGPAGAPGDNTSPADGPMKWGIGADALLRRGAEAPHPGG